MKIVTWLGENCTIPKCGKAVKGKKITLPDDKAGSYIAQGLATLKTQTEGSKDGLWSK